MKKIPKAALKIRKFKKQDAATLADLDKQRGYETPAEQLVKGIKMHRKLKVAEVWVAVIDRRLVGFLFVRKFIGLSNKSAAEIGSMVVDEKYRRKGIGKKLIERAGQWAIKNKLRQLWVRTNVKRTDANIFYPEAGFKLSRQQNVYELTLS